MLILFQSRHQRKSQGLFSDKGINHIVKTWLRRDSNLRLRDTSPPLNPLSYSALRGLEKSSYLTVSARNIFATTFTQTTVEPRYNDMPREQRN